MSDKKHVIVLLTNFSLTGAGVYTYISQGKQEKIDLMCYACSPLRFNNDIGEIMARICARLDEVYVGVDVKPIIICYDLALSREDIEDNIIGRYIPSAFTVYFDTHDSVIVKESDARYAKIEHFNWNFQLSKTLKSMISTEFSVNHVNLFRIIGKYNEGSNIDGDVEKVNRIFWSIVPPHGMFNKSYPARYEAFSRRFSEGFSGYYRNSDEDMTKEVSAATFTALQDNEPKFKVVSDPDGSGKKHIFVLLQIDGYQKADLLSISNHYNKLNICGAFIVTNTGVYFFSKTLTISEVWKIIPSDIKFSYRSPRRATLVPDQTLLVFLEDFIPRPKTT